MSDTELCFQYQSIKNGIGSIQARINAIEKTKRQESKASSIQEQIQLYDDAGGNREHFKINLNNNSSRGKVFLVCSRTDDKVKPRINFSMHTHTFELAKEAEEIAKDLNDLKTRMETYEEERIQARGKRADSVKEQKVQLKAEFCDAKTKALETTLEEIQSQEILFLQGNIMGGVCFQSYSQTQKLIFDNQEEQITGLTWKPMKTFNFSVVKRQVKRPFATFTYAKMALDCVSKLDVELDTKYSTSYFEEEAQKNVYKQYGAVPPAL
jgi:hypothetical protein